LGDYSRCIFLLNITQRFFTIYFLFESWVIIHDTFFLLNIMQWFFIWKLGDYLRFIYDLLFIWKLGDWLFT